MKKEITENGVIKLIADEHKALTNGITYGIEIYLSKFDSEENWNEINIEDIPEEENFHDDYREEGNIED